MPAFSKAALLGVLLAACPAEAVVWVQGGFTAGAAAGSTTTAQSGWTAYDSADSSGVVVSTGAQLATGIPRFWLQTDDGVGDNGFDRSGRQLSTATITGSGAAASLSMVLGESVTLRGATLPLPRSLTSTAYDPVRKKFFIFGGRNASGAFSNDILSYDPAADSLVDTGHNLTGARAATSAAYDPATGHIFVFGGFDAGGFASAEILEYDPDAGSVVTQTANLPSGRSRTAAVHDPATAKIYVFGGSETFTSNLLSQIVEYDPALDLRVIKSTTLPTARADLSAQRDPATGLIHLFGGLDSGGFLSEIVAYDAVNDSRTVRAGTLPNGRAAMGTSYDTGTSRFYLFGGNETGGTSSQVLEYDPVGDSLNIRPVVLPSSRAYASAAFRPDDGTSYLFGGTTGTLAGFSSVFGYLRFATGTYTSSVFDTGSLADLTAVAWTPAVPFSSAVGLEIGVRAGPTAVPNAGWSNGGAFQSFANGASLSGLGVQRYVQYKATFTTTVLSTSAVLDDLTLSYSRTASSGTFLSSAFDSGEVLNTIQRLQWQGSFPAGTTVQFQIRTATDSGTGFPAAFGPFLGPTGTGDFYTNAGGSVPINILHQDADADQWFQFRFILGSSNTLATPTLSTVTIVTTPRPAVPASVSLVALSTADVRYEFMDASNNENDFLVTHGPTDCSLSTAAVVVSLDTPGTGTLYQTVIGGQTPNAVRTVCSRSHISPPTDMYSLYSSSLNIFTWANTPGQPGAVIVSTGFVQISWAANANPGYTVYEVSRSTDPTFTVAVTTPVPIANGLTATTTNLFGLAPGTTHYFRIQAQNQNAIRTAFSVVGSTETPPAPVTGVVGTALGTSSLSFTWNASGPAVDYRVFDTTSLTQLAVVDSELYIEQGLLTNTSHSIRVLAFNNVTQTGLSQAATAFTLAETPGAFAFAFNSSDTIALTWSAGSNPAATPYEISLSTDGFTTSFSTPVPFSNGLTQPATTLFGLAVGTTYHLRLRARNGDAVPTAFAGVLSTQTFPGGLSPPSGTPLGVSSITWTWSAASGPALSFYRVFRASDASLLAVVSTNSFTETGLTTNTAYGLFVAAVNDTGQGPLSAQTTTFTPPTAPVGTALAGLFKSSVTVTWNSNGNPAASSYEFYRSSSLPGFSLVAVVATTTYSDVNLIGLTTYYWRVRTIGAGGGFSLFDSTVSAFVLGDPPLPPSGFTAVPVGGNFIRLSWQISPSTTVARYLVYYDNATGIIDYGTIFQTLLSPGTSFIVGPLTPGATYLFGLRAEDTAGVNDNNFSVIASAAALPTLTPLSAFVVDPPAGRSVDGDRLTLSAAFNSGTAAQASRVLFQYRLGATTTWLDVPAVSSSRPNPAVQAPFKTQFDVTGLASGLLTLRAVARDAAGFDDSFPPSVTLLIDHGLPDIQEISLGGGSTRKRLRVYDSAPASLVAAAETSALIAEVNIDSGAVAASDTFLRVVMAPVGLPDAPASLANPRIAVDVTLESGQTQLSGGRRARLRISGLDRDGDNRVDGTAVRADNLAFFYRDTAANAWVRDFPSAVSASDGLSVTGLSPHFTLFGLFSPESTDLSNVRVYPVPFKPHDGDPDNGKPFSPGDPTSGIIFDGLPGNGKIKIYTVNGSLVWESPDLVVGGLYQWDARNSDGREVVTGVYFAVITGGASPAVVRKIAVVR